MKQSTTIRRPLRPRRVPRAALAPRRPTPRLGTRGRPEESRAAILKAAVAEFAEHGIAGARTDAIARAAHVNKALLYYYFKDKDALYEAVLDHVFGGLRDAGDAGARKQTAAAAEDAGISGRIFRLHRGQSAVSAGGAGGVDAVGRRQRPMQRVAKEYFRPIFVKAGRSYCGRALRRGNFGR